VYNKKIYKTKKNIFNFNPGKIKSAFLESVDAFRLFGPKLDKCFLDDIGYINNIVGSNISFGLYSNKIGSVNHHHALLKDVIMNTNGGDAFVAINQTGVSKKSNVEKIIMLQSAYAYMQKSFNFYGTTNIFFCDNYQLIKSNNQNKTSFMSGALTHMELNLYNVEFILSFLNFRQADKFCTIKKGVLVQENKNSGVLMKDFLYTRGFIFKSNDLGTVFKDFISNNTMLNYFENLTNKDTQMLLLHLCELNNPGTIEQLAFYISNTKQNVNSFNDDFVSLLDSIGKK
jgi:hypothetical protein